MAIYSTVLGIVLKKAARNSNLQRKYQLFNSAVAAVSIFALVLLGKIQPKEVSIYGLHSEYPQSWHKSARNKGD